MILCIIWTSIESQANVCAANGKRKAKMSEFHNDSFFSVSTQRKMALLGKKFAGPDTSSSLCWKARLEDDFQWQPHFTVDFLFDDVCFFSHIVRFWDSSRLFVCVCLLARAWEKSVQLALTIVIPCNLLLLWGYKDCEFLFRWNVIMFDILIVLLKQAKSQASRINVNHVGMKAQPTDKFFCSPLDLVIHYPPNRVPYPKLI